MKKQSTIMGKMTPLLSRRTFISSTTAGSAMTALSLMSFSSLNSVSLLNKMPDPKTHPLNVPDDKKLLLGMVVFEGFQLLDTFGPLEMFGALKDKVTILIIGENAGTIKSTAGPAVLVDYTFADCYDPRWSRNAA
jgi:hypothetical protein